MREDIRKIVTGGELLDRAVDDLQVEASVVRPQPDRRVQKLRTRLDAERAALSRWQTKLRRAFNSVEKLQRSIQRIERLLGYLEE